jgi:PAS domain S-box-containing protein
MSTHVELRRSSGAIAASPQLRDEEVRHVLESMFRSTLEGVIVIDPAHHIVLVNPSAERIFGYAAQELLEQPLDRLLPPGPGKEHAARLESLTAACPPNNTIRRSIKGRHASGALLSLDTTISHVRLEEEFFLAITLHDVRPARAAPGGVRRMPRLAELRRRAATSQHASEVEKRHFSRKLYDDIGQRLSVLKLDLAWLENSLSDGDGSLPARVAEMQDMLDHVITTTKSVASALRPPLLDDFGLLAAVEWMAANFQKRNGIDCRVESSGMPAKLDEPLESGLFRIIQEALTNIEQHAHASQVGICFMGAKDELDVMIADNGIGMADGSEGKSGCYGLIAMQERVFALGGTIRIESAQPHGVAIRVSIPL